MDIIIRKARPHEWDKLVNIYRQENDKEAVLIVSKTAPIEFQGINSKRIIWFAEINGEVVGSIQLVLASPYKGAMIHHLRVHVNCQNKGIGAVLMSTAEQEAKRRNIQIITLEVDKINTKAQEIYKHLGYTYLQEGNDQKEIVMIKKLSNL